ncbi:unnamed protein product [Gordionus sp. m RMFG-2023]
MEGWGHEIDQYGQIAALEKSPPMISYWCVLNPYNSWRNFKEGIILHEYGIDPYDGDMFHENPIDLKLFSLLNRWIPNGIPYIFIVIQIITSLIIYQNGKLMINFQKNFNLKWVYTSNIPLNLMILYLYNPVNILDCALLNSSVFQHLIVCTILNFCLKGNLLVSSIVLSVLFLHSYNAMILVIPSSLILYYHSCHDNPFKKWIDLAHSPSAISNDDDNDKNVNKYSNIMNIIIVFTTLTFLFFACLLLLCFYLSPHPSWKFLDNCFIQKFFITDYTPNLGISWYTFAESFPHFQTFFLWMFRIPCFIYFIPLSIKYGSIDPIFLFYMFLILIVIFEPYPALGDMFFLLSFFPLWYKQLFPFMRQPLLYGCMFLASITISPIIWYLWIYADTANANFYYGMSILYTLSQILFLSDLIYAYNLRRFVLVLQIDDLDAINKGEKPIQLPKKDDIQFKFPFF